MSGYTVWEAVEIDGRIRRARDTETGAIMKLLGTPEIDLTQVVVRSPKSILFPFLGDRETRFVFIYEPKRSEGSEFDNATVPNIKLDIYSFQSNFRLPPGMRQASGRFEKNTKRVRHLIDGLATINRKWPLCKNPKFYSNFSEYKKKNIPIPEFEFPSDEELARL